MALTSRPYHAALSGPSQSAPGLIGSQAAFRPDGPNFGSGNPGSVAPQIKIPMIKIPGVPNIKIQITGKGGTGLGGGKDGTGLGGGKDGTGLGGGKDGTGLGGGKDGTGLGGGDDGTGLGGGKDGTGLTFGTLEFGGQGGTGLTFGTLEFGGDGGTGLVFGTGLEWGGKGGTGLGGGKDGTGIHGGGLGEKGKLGGGNGARVPVFKPIICGQPLTGQRTLEVEWIADDWDRVTYKVWTFKAEINGEDWAQSDHNGYINPTYTPDFTIQPQRGIVTALSPEKKSWKLALGPHSRDCEVNFNRPDPEGKIITSEVLTKPLVNGETSDQFLQAKAGESIFPSWPGAWLTP